MTMPSSGLISLFDCNDEFGTAHAGPVSLQDDAVRNLAGVTGPSISLWDLYGKSSVINYYWNVPGTYTIPGSAGKSSAVITMKAGGGGGGGGGHGGDGDSTGAGGGGAGGGGGGDTVQGVIHFPAGTGLTVVVGDGGAGGQRGIGWAVVDGTWLTGNNGSRGQNGYSSYIYDVNGTLLAVVDGGLGGGGGQGGGRSNTDYAAGGAGGTGYPNGVAGSDNGSYTRGGAGGAGGGNGGQGGKGGDGVGYTGEDGDSGLRQEGLDGNVGLGGQATIAFGATDNTLPNIAAAQLSVTVPATVSIDTSSGDVTATIAGGVKAYSIQWNEANNTGLTVSNKNSATCTVTGTDGSVDLTCTVTDGMGKVVTSGTSSVTLQDLSGGACVAVDSFLPTGVLAGDIVVGSVMELGDDQTLALSTGVVSFSERATVQGFRIMTSTGAALRCSDTAPIPTQNGYMTPAALLGEMVPVMRVAPDGSNTRGWEEVVSVENIGLLEVQHITVGDKCFWAGEQADAFILHHNVKAAP